MNPLFFNPTTPTATLASNFIGSNPLENYRPPEPPSRMDPAYFNPTLFDPFTFKSQSPVPFFQTYSSTYGTYTTQSVGQTSFSVALGSHQSGVYSYLTELENNLTTYYNTQTYVYDIIYAPTASGGAVTFGSRFGTGVQTIYFSAQSYTDTTLTVTDITTETIDVFSTVVSTFYNPMGTTPWTYLTETDSTPSSSTFGVFDSFNTLGSTVHSYSTAASFSVTSMFVDMLGSNVYQGLIGASNSIIIYQNEQVSSYYSESLSYQVNITNLTAALNSVAQTSDGYGTGAGYITVTNFAWSWTFSSGIGWTGTQLTTNSGTFTYTYTETASQFLADPPWTTTIDNSSVAVQQVQALLTTQDNGLSNAQTFLNNAVTTLQSQVSLTGQIIASLASLSQSITTNIASG